MAALKNRPLAIRPKPSASETSTLNDNPPIVIQNADGSITQVMSHSDAVPVVSEATVTVAETQKEGEGEQNAGELYNAVSLEDCHHQ